MAKDPFLVTLLPSTDVDLGRWLLKHYGIAHTERPHAPIFHILALAWWGEGKDAYPLLIDNGDKSPKVDAIWAKYEPTMPAEQRLIPDPETEKALHDEVMELQKAARFTMGTGVVHWSYFHFLQHRKVVWPSITTGVPWWETAFLTFGYGLIKYLMNKGLGLSQPGSEKALSTVLAAWDKTDARLSDGRTFLAGDRLTLADIAFSASGAPMVLANGYGGCLPDFEDCPPNMQSVFAELRERPTGRYIQSMYNRYRT